MSLKSVNFEPTRFSQVPAGFSPSGLNAAGLDEGQSKIVGGTSCESFERPASIGCDHERAASAPKRLSAAALVTMIRAADGVMLILGGVAASHGCALLATPLQGGKTVATLVATAAAAITLERLQAYRPSQLIHPRRRIGAIALAMLAGGVFGAACLAAEPISADVWLWPLLWLAFAGAGLGTAALATACFVGSASNRDRFARRFAVVGDTPYSRTFIAHVRAGDDRTARFVGLYDDGFASGPRGVAVTSDLSVLGSIDDLVMRSRRERIDAIVLALPLSDQARIARSHAALRTVTTDIYVAAELFELTCRSSRADRLGPSAVMKIGSRPLDDWQMAQKRAFDLLLSSLLFLATLPIMAIIAVLIRIDSPGPILFRQPRLGFNNNMFEVYKFRTMYHHMTDLNADCQTTRNDIRVTRIGRLLRKTSLDEVPQLLNVLHGDMSLVGPRPHAANTKAGDHLFHDVVADYAVRHRVKPGITGWAQVNGWRGETRTRNEIEQRVAHDFHYIDNWSLFLDMKIIALTIVREFNSKAAF